MAAHLDNALAQQNGSLEPLVSGYRPLPGVFDEMMDADGRLRGHWQPLLSMLSGLGGDEINRRFAAADRYLRDSGVFYRVYEDPAGVERPWPLSHVPLLIAASEWKQLEAGLIQRAGLLEAVLADAYGPAELIRDGRLPAALVAGNPEFLRPLVGVAPTGGAHLRFYAVDIGRGPDGRWWVLGDRTQAPSGAGYAIESRLALARAMPDVYRAAHVERVAPFFRAFQAELSAFNRHDDTRVCLLTPGAMNETYFEHAYLARYLGLLLVEGEDLTVRDDGVFIRTISGLRRAEVLLRRLDADFSRSARTQCGLTSRRRRTGASRARRQCRHRQLARRRSRRGARDAGLPAGIGADRARQRSRRAEYRDMVARPRRHSRTAVGASSTAWSIAPAFTDSPPNMPLGDGTLVAQLGEAQRRDLMASIQDRGVDYVAQEAVTLSTTPVWRDGRLQPRPFTLRLFLAKVGERWRVMPGGFVRIAESADARAVSLQRGAATADAWVLSDAPVAETTLLPTAGADDRPAGDRRAAKPGRRQFVLAGALFGARGSDAAARSRPDQPCG